MRPDGVIDRVRALRSAEQERARRRPELSLRRALAHFITSCGKQGFHDHPVQVDLDLHDEASFWRDDSAQTRRGSAFEECCFEALDGASAAIEHRRLLGAGALTWEDHDALRGDLLRIVPRAVIGSASWGDLFFDLICWNEANCLLECVRSPYSAASSISWAGFHEPPDPFGLLAPLTTARVAYEDEPERRPELDERIRAVLADFVDRAPTRS